LASNSTNVTPAEAGIQWRSKLAIIGLDWINIKNKAVLHLPLSRGPGFSRDNMKQHITAETTGRVSYISSRFAFQ
jgi:hypothetical protein